MKTVGYRLLLALVLLLADSACSVKKLGSELERADATYGYIKVVAAVDRQRDGNILVALYESLPEGPKMVDTRSVTSGEAAIFLVTIARYELVAFDDVNGDFIYQRGEPVQRISDLPLNTSEQLSDDSYVFDELVGPVLRLSTSALVNFPVDLTERSVEQQLERSRSNFLAVTDWQDERFSPARVKQGMWEPLSFEEEVGFGLYLLEPFDPSKRQVVFVHGINGSPTQFRALVESLGEDYQALLYQYPSGFPLDHSAYMLQTGLDALVNRYSISSLSIVAHSMGGLVSRGAIVLAAEGTAGHLDTFITLSTPWLGHEAARSGVQWSPVVAPVWRAMVPNSDYQRRIYAEPLPPGLEHHLFISYARERGGSSKGDDGVVTVKSQLGYRAQLEATSIRGVEDNHNGILENSCTLAWVPNALASGSVTVPSECGGPAEGLARSPG